MCRWIRYSFLNSSKACRSPAAAALGSADFMMAETTQMPAMGMPFSTPRLSRFSPPMAFTGMGTALQISPRVSVEVMTVTTLVVVG